MNLQITGAKQDALIDFRRFNADDKELYEKYFLAETERGCEFSFANLYLWGRQSFAETHGHIVLFSQFDRRTVYPFPVGSGDKKQVIDAIIADSKARGIPCRITGIGATARRLLEELYPDRFRFHCDEGSFDYVYDINDLAELKGKKYQSKRNHLHRFEEAFPNFRAEPLCADNMPAVKAMVEEWYRLRLEENPEADLYMEKVALERAMRDRDKIGMEGLAILDGDRVIAMTMGSRLSFDTFDVQFEKAFPDIQGAYPAINRCFARYIREKYPEILYLDREEDMGIEGLRRAKQSYHPHHMIKKCWACLLEDGYDY